MGDQPLSTLIAVMSALLGALVVVLVVLRVVVKRATEAWARNHWEQHTREILEVEHVAAEVVAEDEARAAAEEKEKEKEKSGLSPEEQVAAEPVSKGPPDEDPAERRKRERRERAARIRERIRKRRIGERLLGEGPSEAPATYGGRPKAVEESGGPAAPPAGMPRRRSRGAAAWGAAVKPKAPAAPAPEAPPKGIGISGTPPSSAPDQAMPTARRQAAPAPAPQPAPAAPAQAPLPVEPAPQQAMPPAPTTAGMAPRPVPPAQPEPPGPAQAPSSPTPPKKRRQKKKPANHKKKAYNAPPDPSTLPAELIAKIKELDAQGRTILANKAYREATGVSFRDAEAQVKLILASP